MRHGLTHMSPTPVVDNSISLAKIKQDRHVYILQLMLAFFVFGLREIHQIHLNVGLGD